MPAEERAHPQDYYELLQVHPRADADALAAAYARLRDRYDPAHLDDAPDELRELARQKRAAIEHAYAVLRDPDQRAAFDAQIAASSATESPATTTSPPTADTRTYDYRPLPPAGRAERPRQFDTQPMQHTRPEPPPHARRRPPHPLLVFAAIMAIALSFTLGLTNRSATPVPPTPTPEPAADLFDQFEALIPKAQAATEQNPTSAQTWIDYANILYNSAEIVRENMPESELYRARLPRWLQATEAYSRALTLDPANAGVRADLGVSACFYGAGVGDQNSIRRGLAEVQHAVQAAPNDPRILLSLGHCQINTQPPQTQAALDSWQKVIQYAPADSPLVPQARALIAHYQQ